MSDQPVFDCWCIIELFGHARLAGRVTEQTIAGNGLIRVDVPALPATKYNPEQPGFTRLLGVGAIYSITPVSEEIAMRAAESMRVPAVNVHLAAPQLGGGVDWGRDEEDDDDRGSDEEDDLVEDDDDEEEIDHHYVDTDSHIRDETTVKVNEGEAPF